jgi:hypothetical protein
LETIQGSGVEDLVLSSRLHHKSSSNGIKRVGGDTSSGGDGLGDEEFDSQVGILQERFGRVKSSEVEGSVDNDTEDGDDESLIKSANTIRLGDFGQNIEETVEFSLVSLSKVSSESGSGEVEGIDEQEGAGTSSTSGSQVAEEKLHLFSLGVVWAENLFVGIFEGEVKCLGGEVTDNVSEVTSPEGSKTLFFADS